MWKVSFESRVEKFESACENFSLRNSSLNLWIHQTKYTNQRYVWNFFTHIYKRWGMKCYIVQGFPEKFSYLFNLLIVVIWVHTVLLAGWWSSMIWSSSDHHLIIWWSSWWWSRCVCRPCDWLAGFLRSRPPLNWSAAHIYFHRSDCSCFFSYFLFF